MSTRATYHFISGQRFRPNVTVYIHCDGYQEGASSYFYNALTHSNQRGGLVEQFIRANDGAEITESHSAHGDTEYRYTVTGSGPSAALVVHAVGQSVDRNFRVIYTGSLADFIAANTGQIDDFTPFKAVAIGYGREDWLNEATALRRLESKYGALSHLRVWTKHGSASRDSGNWKAIAGELALLVGAFPSLVTDEIRDFLSLPVAV